MPDASSPAERLNRRWRETMRQFEEEVWPVLFEGKGYTKAEAHAVWLQMVIESLLTDLLDDVRSMDVSRRF